MTRTRTFISAQRDAQSRYFERHAGYLMDGWLYRLRPDDFQLNLNPAFATSVAQHFDKKIQWHRHANHGLSSQVCCVNFLAPLAHQSEVLSRVIGAALGIAPPEMLPVGDPEGDRYVDFEWIGKENHLGEWPTDGTATRGANATSADAIVRCRLGSGICTILIEWKYTERYGQPLADSGMPGHGNDKRRSRYAEKLFNPCGPIRADLGLSLDDFFWEPFYQLARQQMLAYRMEQSHEGDSDRVMVLHLSPRGNTALHRVTSPALAKFGTDAFEVFQTLLVHPDRFHFCSIEDAFAGSLEVATEGTPAAAWASYLRERYTFLTEPA